MKRYCVGTEIFFRLPHPGTVLCSTVLYSWCEAATSAAVATAGEDTANESESDGAIVLSGDSYVGAIMTFDLTSSSGIVCEDTNTTGYDATANAAAAVTMTTAMNMATSDSAERATISSIDSTPPYSASPARGSSDNVDEATMDIDTPVAGRDGNDVSKNNDNDNDAGDHNKGSDRDVGDYNSLEDDCVVDGGVDRLWPDDDLAAFSTIEYGGGGSDVDAMGDVLSVSPPRSLPPESLLPSPPSRGGISGSTAIDMSQRRSRPDTRSSTTTMNLKFNLNEESDTEEEEKEGEEENSDFQTDGGDGDMGDGYKTSGPHTPPPATPPYQPSECSSPPPPLPSPPPPLLQSTSKSTHAIAAMAAPSVPTSCAESSSTNRVSPRRRRKRNIISAVRTTQGPKNCRPRYDDDEASSSEVRSRSEPVGATVTAAAPLSPPQRGASSDGSRMGEEVAAAMAAGEGGRRGEGMGGGGETMPDYEDMTLQELTGLMSVYGMKKKSKRYVR